MKLVGRHIEKGGEVGAIKLLLLNANLNTDQGYVTLRPEDDEDMWHLYNLIQQVCLFSTLIYIYIYILISFRETKFEHQQLGLPLHLG